MARTRLVKPSFFQDEELSDLGPDAQLLYIGLWQLADREGLLEDRPRQIKAHVFPYRDVNVEQLLGDLAKPKEDGSGFVVRYAVDGRRYLHLPKLGEHQHFHKDERARNLPKPREPDTNTAQAPCNVGVATVVAPEQHGANPPLIFNLESSSCNPAAADAGSAAPQAQGQKKKTRKPSIQEEFAQWFETTRKESLGASWCEDDRLSVERINTELGWLKDADLNVVSEAARLYIDDPKRRAKDPPCNLVFFSRDRAGYLSKARRELGAA